MRIIAAIAITISLVGLVAAQTPSTYDIAGRASVIDADTVEIHGQRIRIFGVDAPEKRQPCFDADGVKWSCGQRSALLVSEFIRDRPVQCRSKDHDRYGRVVAQCWVAGVDIGEWLVSNGLAVAYRRYASDYIGAEQGAKNRHAGIWSGRFDLPWEWRRQQREGQ
jgi:endonuclease YncB( thermonuclease family)